MANLKWTIEFEVDESWIADGFNLTDEAALNMIELLLPNAYDDEIAAKVIQKPTDAEIKDMIDQFQET